jgi:hypothetical protein
MGWGRLSMQAISPKYGFDAEEQSGVLITLRRDVLDRSKHVQSCTWSVSNTSKSSDERIVRQRARQGVATRQSFIGSEAQA